METETKEEVSQVSVFAKEFARLFHIAFDLQCEAFEKAAKRSTRGRWIWGISLLLYVFFMFAGAYVVAGLFLVLSFGTSIWNMTVPGGEMDKALGHMKGLIEAHEIVMEAKKSEIIDRLKQIEKNTGEEISLTTAAGTAKIVRTPKKKLDVKEEKDEK